jgi:hypothetical protein
MNANPTKHEASKRQYGWRPRVQGMESSRAGKGAQVSLPPSRPMDLQYHVLLTFNIYVQRGITLGL